MPAIIALFRWLSSKLSRIAKHSKPGGPGSHKATPRDEQSVRHAILIIDLSARLGYFAARNYALLFAPVGFISTRSPYPEGVAMKSTARLGVALAIFLAGSLISTVVARQQSSDQSEPLVRRSDLYCTGFIADTSPRVDLQVVGAEKEHTRLSFAQGDVVFLNRG